MITPLWLILVLASVAVFLLATFIKGAPFVPTSGETIKKMLEIALAARGTKMADLGSGDGRIVIAFAAAGVEAHGYEINPFLVWYSRWKVRKAGLSGRAFIHWGDFWRVNLSTHDVVVFFGRSGILNRLEIKLKRELARGAIVLSNAFRFRDWRPSGKRGSVIFYRNG